MQALEDNQELCNTLLETTTKLKTIIPNEQFKNRLGNKTQTLVEQWNELYHREKHKILGKDIQDEKDKIEDALKTISTELNSIEEQFSSDGYSKELYEKCKVIISLPSSFFYFLSLHFILFSF